MFIKVCGLRTPVDVATAVAAGADAVGFVFARSVRRVDVPTARELAALVPDSVLTVGVFADVPAAEAAQLATAAGVRAIQLHGDYPRAAFDEVAATSLTLIRATTLTPQTDVAVGAFGEDLLLLDAPVPGAGQTWDLTLLERAQPQGKWVLAGGLNPDNVGAAIRAARPWGVDVSSGVESARGVKDPERIRRFVAAARAV